MEVEKDDTVYKDERNFLFYKFIVKVSCEFGGVVIDKAETVQSFINKDQLQLAFWCSAPRFRRRQCEGRSFNPRKFAGPSWIAGQDHATCQ